jgi:hypothetical protein
VANGAACGYKKALRLEACNKDEGILIEFVPVNEDGVILPNAPPARRNADCIIYISVRVAGNEEYSGVVEDQVLNEGGNP